MNKYNNYTVLIIESLLEEQRSITHLTIVVFLQDNRVLETGSAGACFLSESKAITIPWNRVQTGFMAFFLYL